ncbi:hypothetical protein B0J15DRAFT_459464 [Fusarium solani]|uniref:Uncharacterized protein n=1 Tax=Fusarium solani TaxID=169388 RepID=A0A9P9RD42_FUSSL|nr:uncharacterized protein B0J15DRAFT_459464 [Fusarium solani]KAH7274419.1 hypothetical protein B0J15DRAFT_459464 [Fusarium solani]
MTGQGPPMRLVSWTPPVASQGDQRHQRNDTRLVDLANKDSACRADIEVPGPRSVPWPRAKEEALKHLGRMGRVPGRRGVAAWTGLAGTGECGRGIWDPRSWTGLDPPEVVRSPVEMVQPPDRGLRDAPVAERRGRVVASAALTGVVLLVEHLLWPSSNGRGRTLFHAARLAGLSRVDRISGTSTLPPRLFPVSQIPACCSSQVVVSNHRVATASYVSRTAGGCAFYLWFAGTIDSPKAVCTSRISWNVEYVPRNWGLAEENERHHPLPKRRRPSRDGGENGSSGKRDGESYVPLLTPSPTKNPSSTNEMELVDDRLMFQWPSLNTTSKRPEHSATVSRNKEPDHPMAGTSAPGLAWPVRPFLHS